MIINDRIINLQLTDEENEAQNNLAKVASLVGARVKI